MQPAGGEKGPSGSQILGELLSLIPGAKQHRREGSSRRGSAVGVWAASNTKRESEGKGFDQNESGPRF